MVPVSIRTGDETERWTNRVSSMAAVLPTDSGDPLERLQQVHDSMGNAKELFGAMPAETMTDFAQFSPPALFTRAMRASARLHLGDRLDPAANLIISNVPGPRQPLYAAGAKLLHYYPVSTIVEGQGLNITVQSYQGNLDWGLVSCRELVPDLDRLLDFILADLDEMSRLASLSTSTAAPTAASVPATPTPRKRAAKRAAPSTSSTSAG